MKLLKDANIKYIQKLGNLALLPHAIKLTKKFRKIFVYKMCFPGNLAKRILKNAYLKIKRLQH